MRACLPLLLILAWLPPHSAAQIATGSGEPREEAWTFHLDNDLFAFADRDRDYTAGLAFTRAGEPATEHPRALARTLSWLDRRHRLGDAFGDDLARGDSIEFGFLLFTPRDLSAQAPLEDDRPYANLAYVSASRLRHDASLGTAFQSSITFGLIGLPAAEQLHRSVHRLIGSAEPMGYDHQVSRGGEPAFRYALTRSRLLRSGQFRERPFSLVRKAGASIGYLSELNAEIEVRWGRAAPAWWRPLPVSADYAGHPPVWGPQETRGRARPEVAFDAGIKSRIRLYNSFLQGQFRDSAVRYSSSHLNRALLEAWIGVTVVLRNGVNISYALRGQTEEVDSGRGARGSTWATIGVSKRL